MYYDTYPPTLTPPMANPYNNEYRAKADSMAEICPQVELAQDIEDSMYKRNTIPQMCLQQF
jgi:hypothetical protein